MSSPISAERLTAARQVYAFLSETDMLPATPADAVIGFGTFDVRLASYCGDLHAQGRARRILFTGGIGAGTTDLGMPEADAWLQQLARTHPQIDLRTVIAENASTNTAENIRFTAALLLRDHPTVALGDGIRSAVIVASPSRLRRVKLTLQKLEPAVTVYRSLPHATFETERALYEGKRIPYVAHLLGELDRIESYPARDWIIAEPLPSEVIEARSLLRRFP